MYSFIFSTETLACHGEMDTTNQLVAYEKFKEIPDGLNLTALQ